MAAFGEVVLVGYTLFLQPSDEVFVFFEEEVFFTDGDPEEFEIFDAGRFRKCVLKVGILGDGCAEGAEPVELTGVGEADGDGVPPHPWRVRRWRDFRGRI